MSTTMPKQKVCVILGAGASHDVANRGTKFRDRRFRPPLAKDLFDMQEHEAYWDVIEPYPGAKVLAASLGPLIASGERGIEDALRHYAEHPTPQPQEHFKYIPGYLRDLMYKVSSNYVESPNCYLQLVEQLLAETDQEVLFLALNYDTLLEAALEQYFPEYFPNNQYGNLMQYMANDKPFKVIKLHGSINWFRRLARMTETKGTWAKVIQSVSVDELTVIPENEIFVESIPCVAHAWDDGKRAYPVITAPLSGKSLDQAVCPNSHLEVGKEFLKDCRKFLIVGTSGLDDDLMELLRQTVPASGGVYLHVVGWRESASKTKTNFQNKVRGFTETFPMGAANGLFRDGFKDYVSGSGMQAFANYKVGAGR